MQATQRRRQWRWTTAAQAAAGDAGNASASAAATAAAEAEARYPALLAILLRLSAPGDEERFAAFVAAQPSATAVPFISWVADLEARAARGGEERAALGALCERLVFAREAAEADGLDELYAASLRLIAEAEGAAADGDEEDEEQAQAAALAIVADPATYAARLAEAVTGVPALREGYGAAYDALLAAAPPAALTPEGVALAHKEAAELAEDMRARRRRSFAAILGRVKIATPEQEAALLAPSAASRILDLLLSLATHAERAALLPDCFTPPPPAAATAEGGGAAAAAAAAATPVPPQQGVVEGDETDELWCTPLQLLNEVDARVRDVVEAPAARAAGGESAPRAIGTAGGLSGEAYAAALRELREEVAKRWLDGLPTAPSAAIGSDSGGAV